MAKKYTWEIKETVENEETGVSEEVTHSVSLHTSMLTGKAIVTIDGSKFDISTHPFGLRGTQQMFRLGETAAILNFPKKGAPDIIIDGVCVRTGKPCEA